MVRSETSSSAAILAAVTGRRWRRRTWMICNSRSARRISCPLIETYRHAPDSMLSGAWQEDKASRRHGGGADQGDRAMITLYSFGPASGLPDPSPFVMKADLLLKMANLPYRAERASDPRKAPKGKIPYIDDDGEVIADSTFIRWHLEKKYKIDFDLGLTPEQRATAWAFEKMAEDHLYWALLDARWMNDANFLKGPSLFFRGVPAPMRPFIVAMVRRKVRHALHAHGMGRHSEAEIAALAIRSIDAIADFLASKPSFM